MNNPMLLVRRLNDLADLASRAGNGYERAAVYAAAKAIKAEFNSAEEKFDGYALEKVSNACWHICAAVGYDITNDHPTSQHVVWAYGEISTLENVIHTQSAKA